MEEVIRQLEGDLRNLTTKYNTLNGAYSTQREALALARAERNRVIALLKKRDTAQAQLAEAELAECSRAHAGLVDEIRAFHAQQPWLLEAKLAEAVGLLKELRPTIPKDVLSLWCIDRDTFLARHAQAEQQEAQGAQAVDERAAFEAVCRKTAIERGGECSPEALRQRPDGTYISPLTQCGWWGWQARAALATQPAVPVAEHPVVKALLAVAAAAHLALEGTDSDGVDSTWDEADRESLDAAIEVLDRLPDDQPGYIMEPAAKAAWALRNLNAVQEVN